MKYLNKLSIVFLALTLGLFVQSCRDLTELNVNPNGVDIEKANANLILSTVLTQTAQTYNNLGYGDAAGVMQHTQKDAWFGGHNSYDWGPENWGHYYNILRNNEKVYEKAVKNDLRFHQGVALVMKSFLFAQITDLWGDAPYTNALNGDEGGNENLLPAYDSQETIYQGILADLEEAAGLLAADKDSYKEIFPAADVIYNGDPAKWQKFANSLRLRYLMRISNKKDVSSEFANIAQSAPIFTSNDDNAYMKYPGSNDASAWPANTVFDGTNGSNFRRIRPAETLVEALRERNDPRIDIWFEPVEIPTQPSTEIPNNTIVDGIRYMHPDTIEKNNMNTNLDYVGLPTQLRLPSGYNLNPTPGQTSQNSFVSYLDDRYRDAGGPLLNARLMSYAEVEFLLAEAAQKGWINGAETHYNNAITASLEEWTVGDQVSAYLAEPNVVYDGTLEQLITQKWIASWTATQEAWFDYRRTGFPDLSTGDLAKRQAIPLRYTYGSNELNFNRQNVSKAIEDLQLTQYSQDEKNSSWSKPWLIAGTGKPY
ncbi:SusD/RagB family nutrient-binding outer membrane lipoprotein [Membranicola marinus]|uniref:SusD/RagB family nutrient-binding outer membrane lipoprotein n=1 Tax=Membranihabitans marinus TaxID=1227546 RepID=A0A953LAH4_9BACT|nr:SusD/RagB family nutrient-binding outer membrane lipoprotein [Membranihabitans marinus]MBY5959955.1 SusD/RagB family nutrient-binding outer membrane lipoprotein [Membranihabitans marinus]